MKDNTIHLLVSFDQNYIPPFKVMITSLIASNPKEKFHVWLLHSEIPEEQLNELTEYCNHRNLSFTPVQVERKLFQEAPMSKQYPQEMYYRLLAPLLLPENLERILYLDPDILVLNPIRPLWDMELTSHVFAASSHTGVFNFMSEVNKMRLNTEHDYFNSGVLLMNLQQARLLVKPDTIFNCVREHANELILPDQDVFNYLYGRFTLQTDDTIWNYDARYYSAYQLRSGGKCDMDWVMDHTVFLHFCGKQKPWKKSTSNRFAILYKHYKNLSER